MNTLNIATIVPRVDYKRIISRKYKLVTTIDDKVDGTLFAKHC